MPLIRKTPEPQSPVAADLPSLRLLETGSAEERWAAARAAAASPSNTAVLGAALLREQDVRVRQAIFTSLVHIGTEGSLDAIIPHLRSDNSNVRAGTLDALRAMPALVALRIQRLLQDTDPDVRLLACDLLRTLPAAEANRLLCDLLDTEENANVCGVAIDVVAETGGQECLAALERCAVRFPNDPFLAFSIKIAREGITSRPDAGRPVDRRP